MHKQARASEAREVVKAKTLVRRSSLPYGPLNIRAAKATLVPNPALLCQWLSPTSEFDPMEQGSVAVTARPTDPVEDQDCVSEEAQEDASAVDEAAEEEAREKLRREREARAQALTLEIVGDLPYAEVKPPENVLFVCKLNPVTEG